MAYALVKPRVKSVTRAKRSSKVSPANSGSSLISILYFDIIIVMAAMLSVSKNLKKKTQMSTSPHRQRLSLLAPSPDASPGTCNEFVRHDQIS